MRDRLVLNMLALLDARNAHLALFAQHANLDITKMGMLVLHAILAALNVPLRALLDAL